MVTLCRPVWSAGLRFQTRVLATINEDLRGFGVIDVEGEIRESESSRARRRDRLPGHGIIPRAHMDDVCDFVVGRVISNGLHGAREQQ